MVENLPYPLLRGQLLNYLFYYTAGLDISARPLAQASVKTVGQIQITDHSSGFSPGKLMRFGTGRSKCLQHNFYFQERFR